MNLNSFLGAAPVNRVRAALFLFMLALASGDCAKTTGSSGLDGTVTHDGTIDGGSGCSSGVYCGPLRLCCVEDEICDTYMGQSLCLPPCETGIRCGADLRLCCPSDQVCWGGECLAPGVECTDPSVCGPDEVCDTTLGRCMPRPADCQAQPPVGEFTPEVEWHWESLSRDSAIRNVMMTPAVADLDGDGVPEVVFVAFAEDLSSTVVVVRGDTGQELADSGSYEPTFTSHVAVGNLDDDPELEIVVGRYNPPDHGLMVLDYDNGALSHKWTQTGGSVGTDMFSAVGPVIADLDGDGHAEVITGFVVMDGRTGDIIADEGGGAGHGTYKDWLTAVADLDEDGVPEIVSGNRAMTLNGNSLATLWENPGSVDGNMAVGALYTPGNASVVTVNDCVITILDGRTGSVLLPPINLPGDPNNCQGGPPTIADFDGDGAAEIGVAGKSAYTVFDTGCLGPNQPPGCQASNIRWSVTTQDVSSSITGSSVFDFEGDGRAEVVYNDECYLRVYDGTDGTVRLEVPNSSRTAGEYPVIADVDADGNAEIVVVANDYRHLNGDTVCSYPTGTTPTHGVFVYGDRRDRWVSTRPIWNQHTYHVTNVEDDGTIPASEPRHWDQPGLNIFRQNIQPENQFDAPDLVLSDLTLGTVGCPATANLLVKLANLGAVTVPSGLPVSFYRLDGTARTLLGTVLTDVALLPGQVMVLTFAYEIPTEDQGAALTYVAVADDDGTGQGIQTECDEQNNEVSGSLACYVVR